MKTKISFLLAIIALSFSFSLMSCSDNDLDTTGGNGSDTTVDEAKVQKYEALSCLLAAVADVDSLPSNWDDANYAVQPTIGTVNDEANPHVRYVSTTSLEEADRIYRSLLSKDVTGSVSNDSWQMDGIGSMKFEVNNQADLYATLKVNVQQLPTLEEVRFIPASALGQNGFSIFKPAGCYYSLGDVICQMVQNSDGSVLPTFYVCVRPCSKEECLRKTHWCSFQLVNNGDNCDYANYTVTDAGNRLPANLCTKQSDGERFIQNYFNVLRLLANPSFAQDENYRGIGEINADHFSYDSVRTVSYMWEYLGLWDKNIATIKTTDGQSFKCGFINSKYYCKDDNSGSSSEDGSDNDNSQSGSDESKDQTGNDGSIYNGEYLLPLNEYLSQKNPKINVYYYGNKKASFFSKGDYNVYNLNLSINSNTKNGTLFNVAKKQTFNLKDISTVRIDFKDYESGMSNGLLPNGATDDNAKYQFIVKYKTGGELEGESNSSNDKAPNTSFHDRYNKNKIEDVLVWRNHAMEKAFKKDYLSDEPSSSHDETYKEDQTIDKQATDNIDEPLFAFGDKVTETKYDLEKKSNPLHGELFCIKPANDNYAVTTEQTLKDVRSAIFVSNQMLFDKNNNPVSDVQNVDKYTIRCILYHCLNAYLQCNPNNKFERLENGLLSKQLVNDNDDKSSVVNTAYSSALARLYDLIVSNNCQVTIDNENEISIAACFNSSENCYKLTYNKSNDKGSNSYPFTFSQIKNVFANYKNTPIYTFKYFDEYRFYDNFSNQRTFYVKRRSERLGMKTCVSERDRDFLLSFYNY